MALQTVSPQTLKHWLDDGSAVLVDVREPAEHRALSIPGARLMPLGRLDAAALPRHGKLVVHCQKGARGGAGCQRLLAQNPDLEIYNLAGGIEAWAAAGLPVERSGPGLLPLDRQVQLVIGLVLLAGTALALLVNPQWVWLAAVMGLGLTIAGLTGFCGLARVMARLPWNR